MAGFDAMYGAQDEKFDRMHGLHSLVTDFGANLAFKISKGLHVASVICFLAVGVTLDLGILYFVGVLIATLTLIYQHKIVSPKDFSQVTQRYFMRNGIVSVAIFFFTWLSLS